MIVMKRDIFEIRSNITTTFGAFEEARIKREERERKEEQEKRDREFAERQRLSQEWQDTHKNLFKYTYASYYSKDTFNYDGGGFCNVHFYEWSDADREPIKFTSYHRLYEFLDRCGLFLEPEQNTFIKPLASCFITCKPTCKDLIVSSTYDDMKRQLHEAENLVRVLEAVPEC